MDISVSDDVVDYFALGDKKRDMTLLLHNEVK